MNIDYKLEPITEKNVTAYFHGLKILMQDYYITSKLLISLQKFAFLGFIKTVIRENKYLCKD